MLGGIQTSIFTATNVFLDLLSSPADSDYYMRLREEIESGLTTGDGWESQAFASKLHCTDSAIRESLRMSPILTRTGMREVVKKGGVQFPNGQTVPQGAWLAIPAVAIHYDESFYPNSQKYDPFRFVPDTAKPTAPNTKTNAKPTAKPNAKGPSVEGETVEDETVNGIPVKGENGTKVEGEQVEDETVNGIPVKGETRTKIEGEGQYRVLSTSISSASPTFLAFGYGRHSWYVIQSRVPPKLICSPGRWFVALQLKLLVAYIITHYDIERIENRPLHRIIGSHFVPPSVNVKVKRRKPYN